MTEIIKPGGFKLSDPLSYSISFSPCGTGGHNKLPPLDPILGNMLSLTSVNFILASLTFAVLRQVIFGLLGFLPFLLPGGVHHSATFGLPNASTHNTWLSHRRHHRSSICCYCFGIAQAYFFWQNMCNVFAGVFALVKPDWVSRADFAISLFCFVFLLFSHFL